MGIVDAFEDDFVDAQNVPFANGIGRTGYLGLYPVQRVRMVGGFQVFGERFAANG